MSGRISRCATYLLSVLAAAFLITTVKAQTVHTYTSSQNSNLNSGTPCTSPVFRDFNVTDNFSIYDVMLGVQGRHKYRGEVRVILQSPLGTRVQLINGNSTASGDNFNVLLDDAASQLVNTDSQTGKHSTSTPPPFQHTFRPNNPFSAFDGESSAGTWRVEVCDTNPSSQNGSLRYVSLYLSEPPNADLSLNHNVNNSGPNPGANVTLTIAVSSSSSSQGTASGVTVEHIHSEGLSYVSSSGEGSYDPATGIWTVPSIAPGQTRTIQLIMHVATQTPGTSLTTYAQVQTSSAPDPDSTPGDQSLGEDDDDYLTVNVSGSRTAGTPPMLMCPKGTVLFDWDQVAWSAGTVSRSQFISGFGTIAFAISNTGQFQYSSSYGGQSPTRTSAVSGGIPGAGYSLHQNLNFASLSGASTTVISLPAIVSGAQFRLFDIDFSYGQYADRVRIAGSHNGTTVLPLLTNGTANYVVGNEAFGDGSSSNNQSNGNVTVTFDQPIDSITIEFGSHRLAPDDPSGQDFALHDITFCRPDATIAVNKTSSPISDPVSGTSNPMTIPGTVLSYCVRISNSGTANAENVIALDQVPANTTYVPSSLTSGQDCESATTIEDDNASGADESDPLGASISGSAITFRGTRISAGSAIAFRFRTTVD